MKGIRHSEEQIIAILKQGEAGLATAELCRQHGITEATYYRPSDLYFDSVVRSFALVGADHKRYLCPGVEMANFTSRGLGLVTIIEAFGRHVL